MLAVAVVVALAYSYHLCFSQLSTRNKKQFRKKAPMRRHIDTGIHTPRSREGEDGKPHGSDKKRHGSSGGKAKRDSGESPAKTKKHRTK